MATRDLFNDAVNTAVGVGKAAWSKFYAPPSANAIQSIEKAAAEAKRKAAEAAAKSRASPTNPLTKTSAFRTMGQSTKPTFGGFTKIVGGRTVDGLNLVTSGVKMAQGDYDPSLGQVVGDVGSVARIARMNQNVAGRGGAPLKIAADPRATMIAYGLQETVPRLYQQVTNKNANAATYNQNVAGALTSQPANIVEKSIGLPGYNPSQSYKDSVAAGAPVSPNYFGANPSSAAPRKPMQGLRQLGGGATSRPAVYGQLGEIFDFATKRGIEPAKEYMNHIIRRDGLNQQQAQQLYDEFYGKLYEQKSFRK